MTTLVKCVRVTHSASPVIFEECVRNFLFFSEHEQTVCPIWSCQLAGLARITCYQGFWNLHGLRCLLSLLVSVVDRNLFARMFEV